MTGMMKRLWWVWGVGVLMASSALAPAQSAQDADTGPDKVVYHVNEGLEQAGDALRNIRNHLSVDPDAQIKVVTHAKGIDFLLEGASDANGNPYNVPVETLAMEGVEFNVCAITLKSRDIDKSALIPEARVVPSGVGEVTRLQAREGYVYLKP